MQHTSWPPVRMLFLEIGAAFLLHVFMGKINLKQCYKLGKEKTFKVLSSPYVLSELEGKNVVIHLPLSPCFL